MLPPFPPFAFSLCTSVGGVFSLSLSSSSSPADCRLQIGDTTPPVESTADAKATLLPSADDDAGAADRTEEKISSSSFSGDGACARPPRLVRRHRRSPLPSTAIRRDFHRQTEEKEIFPGGGGGEGGGGGRKILLLFLLLSSPSLFPVAEKFFGWLLASPLSLSQLPFSVLKKVWAREEEGRSG